MVLQEIFAAGYSDALKLEAEGDPRVRSEVEQLFNEIGLHLTKGEIVARVLKRKR